MTSLAIGWILIAVALVREVFGSAAISFPGIGQVKFFAADSAVYEMGYMNNNMMILPPMALVVVGIIIWIQRNKNKALREEH